MKTKLLKKLRKRYNWYFNTKKFPVLIDNHKKLVTIFDLEYCCKYRNYRIEEIDNHISMNKDEWALIILKEYLLSKYNWSMERKWYRNALKNYKSLLTNENI